MRSDEAASGRRCTLSFLLFPLVWVLVACCPNRPAEAGELIAFTNVWRYQQGTNLDGVAWTGRSFDDSAWPSGAGVLARETCGCLPQSINTALTVSTNRITFYFRTHFTNAGDWPVDRLIFTNLIDDGAVFYLNGVEIRRTGISAGVISNATLASRSVGNATNSEVFSVTGAGLTNFLSGHNVLSVEVHQNSTNSSDIVFGSAMSMVAVPVPALAGPVDGAVDVPLPTTLQVAVSDPDSSQLTVTYHGWFETLNTGRDFTIVVLPDTQYYSKTYSNLFVAQTDWIVANRTNLNIVYVAHLGDISNDGDNQPYQWPNATNALYRLEDPVLTGLSQGIPYGVVPGNHDHLGGTTQYNAHFGVAHFAARDYYGGNFGTDNQSHYDLFGASGMDFVAVYTDFNRSSINYAPIDAWANGVLAANVSRRAIAVTHAILETDGTFDTSRAPSLYEGLKGNLNLFLMLCGHNHGEYRRQERFQDRDVHICLSDYQSYTNGGNGFLRLYEFSPSNNVIRVKTYSPFLDQFETDADSEFEIPYDMSGMWLPFATHASVASGSTDSAVWSGLTPETQYRWYVTVNDGFTTTQSPTWTFTTLPPSNAPPVASNLTAALRADGFTNLTLLARDPHGNTLTFAVTSVPTHGLISDFNGSLGTLRYTPAHGYAGMDNFTYIASNALSSSVPATVSVTILPLNDTNQNHLPDNWEAAFGINHPDGDADFDNLSNLQEYRANTNPTNAASGLKELSATVAANGQCTITWPSVGGTRYRVAYADGIEGGGFIGPFIEVARSVTEEMDPGPIGLASFQSFTDGALPPPMSGSRYFRIQIVW